MADKCTEVVVLAECRCSPGEPIPKGGLPDYFDRARPCAMHFKALWDQGKRNFAVHLTGRHVIAVVVDGQRAGHWDWEGHKKVEDGDL